MAEDLRNPIARLEAAIFSFREDITSRLTKLETKVEIGKEHDAQMEGVIRDVFTKADYDTKERFRKIEEALERLKEDTEKRIDELHDAHIMQRAYWVIGGLIGGGIFTLAVGLIVAYFSSKWNAPVLP
jgi:tetrahydromethanopterin S-methyltransferase subunit G